MVKEKVLYSKGKVSISGEDVGISGRLKNLNIAERWFITLAVIKQNYKK